ncbi:MAG: glycosyltransferase, partial [Cyanobacteriota bacterium]|nr:glycosyltransferase [Cyanobacteriota bacterium]
MSAVSPILESDSALLESCADQRAIVYAGTLESYQGIDVLIGAFGYVARQEPDTVLLIVGGTPEQVKYYAGMAAECGIADRCIFTGRVPQAEAKEYASRAAVQISSRVSGTNTPLKVYEQLSRPIPLVATNIYSHTQVLNDDVAFLVEPTAKDMGRGILEALKPDGEGRRRAANAQLLYEREYSRKVYTEKMRKLLDSIARSTDDGA